MSDEKATIASLAAEEPIEAAAAPAQQDKGILERIITADTGDKPLEEYNTHALNYDGDDSTSRIIRGTEGIVGSLDKAVVDILVGIFQKASGFFKKMSEKNK